MVGIWFSFSNPAVVPAVLLAEKVMQTGHKQFDENIGRVVLGPEADTSMFSFVHDLSECQYSLVDGLYIRSFNDEGRAKHSLRFLFVKSEHAHCSPEFMAKKHEVMVALQLLVLEAMWQVKIFDNPFFYQGKMIPGDRMLSVNLAARRPLLTSAGEPVMIRVKDPVTGRKLEQLQPLQAEKYLTIRDNNLQVVSV